MTEPETNQVPKVHGPIAEADASRLADAQTNAEAQQLAAALGVGEAATKDVIKVVDEDGNLTGYVSADSSDLGTQLRARTMDELGLEQPAPKNQGVPGSRANPLVVSTDTDGGYVGGYAGNRLAVNDPRIIGPVPGRPIAGNPAELVAAETAAQQQQAEEQSQRPLAPGAITEMPR